MKRATFRDAAQALPEKRHRSFSRDDTMCVALAQPMTVDELDRLAAIIYRTHRAHLRELRIESVNGGVILTGRACSYYGKQMAQEEVLQRGLAIVANDLAVV